MSAPLAVDFQTPISNGLSTIATFVPRLVGALVILLVGYFIAKFVAKIVDKLLERVGFDQAVEKGGVKKALSKSQYDASDIVSKLVFYAIFIPVLSAAISKLGIEALTAPMAQFIALIPRIIVAVVLVVLGGVVAGAVKKLLENTLGGLSYGRVLGDAVGALVLLGFLKAALDQVGIATQVTTPILIAILATAAGILIVGVGGALIKPMQSRLEDALTRAGDEAREARQQVQSSSAGSASSSAGSPVSSAQTSGGATATTAYPTSGSAGGSAAVR